MTQSRNNKPTVKQVLDLVQQLTAGERERLMHELKSNDFRRDIEEGIAAADRGELKPAEEVLARLRKKSQSRT